MSDILIVGQSPSSEEGKEYFLYFQDWWCEIVLIVERLLKDRYPVDKHFIRTLPLAPQGPEMDAEQSLIFASMIEDILQDGSAATCLRQVYQDNPTLAEYYEDDKVLMEDGIKTRIEQLNTLVRFLRSCGGCSVKWYSDPDD